MVQLQIPPGPSDLLGQRRPEHLAAKQEYSQPAKGGIGNPGRPPRGPLLAVQLFEVEGPPLLLCGELRGLGAFPLPPGPADACLLQKEAHHRNKGGCR